MADSGLVALNAALLFVVLFYVYPLKYLAQVFVVFIGAVPGEASAATIGSRDELATLFVLYGAGFGALFAVVALMHRHVARRADAFDLSPLRRHDARWITRHDALFVLAAAVSVAVALTGFGLEWGAPGFAYALLGPLCYVNGKRAEKHAPA